MRGLKNRFKVYFGVIRQLLRQKKGDVEIDKIIKGIIIIIAFLSVVVFITATFFEGGERMVASARDIFKWGRA